MTLRKVLPWLFASLLILAGLLLLILALLPFGAMKTILNGLSRDGNLSILRMDNAIAFRFLILIISLVIFGLGYLAAGGKWKAIFNVFKKSIQDFRRLFSLSNTSKVEKGFLLALLIVTILGIIRRLAFIESPMLHDEAYSVVTFADSFFHAITDYSLPNNHVFHTILVFISIKLFGIAPWTARLPAFLAGVLIIPGVFYLAKRFYDPWTGMLAAVLVAFSPSLIDYSTNARGYTLVALFAIVIIFLGTHVIRGKNLVAWGLISIFSALGLYTVPVFLFPFGILFTWLFLENLITKNASYTSKWEFIRYWVIAGFLACIFTILLYTPVLIYSGPQNLFSNGFVAPLPFHDLPDIWRSRFTETWAEWTYSVPIIVTIVLAIGLISSLIFHRKISSTHVPLQLASLLWIFALLLIQRSNAWAKVWVFLLPLVLIWSSAGIVGIMRQLHLKLPYNLSVPGMVVSLVLLVGVWSCIQLIPKLHQRLIQRGDVEDAVLFFKNSINDTDLIVVDWPDDSSVWFYSLEYGLSNIHFDKRIPFKRAWILVSPQDGQTYATVLADRGPDRPALDLVLITQIQKIGTRLIFEIPIK